MGEIDTRPESTRETRDSKSPLSDSNAGVFFCGKRARPSGNAAAPIGEEHHPPGGDAAPLARLRTSVAGLWQGRSGARRDGCGAVNVADIRAMRRRPANADGSRCHNIVMMILRSSVLRQVRLGAISKELAEISIGLFLLNYSNEKVMFLSIHHNSHLMVPRKNDKLQRFRCSHPRGL